MVQSTAKSCNPNTLLINKHSRATTHLRQCCTTCYQHGGYPSYGALKVSTVPWPTMPTIAALLTVTWSSCVQEAAVKIQLPDWRIGWQLHSIHHIRWCQLALRTWEDTTWGYATWIGGLACLDLRGASGGLVLGSGMPLSRGVDGLVFIPTCSNSLP